MPFCPKCGFQLNENDEFCYKCGNRISIRSTNSEDGRSFDHGADTNVIKDQQTQMSDVCMSLISNANWSSAVDYSKKMIELSPADYRGYYCFILARTQNLTIKQNNSWYEFVSGYFTRILALNPDFKNNPEYERITAFLDMNDKYLVDYFKKKNIITWIIVLIPSPIAIFALIMIILAIIN